MGKKDNHQPRVYRTEHERQYNRFIRFAKHFNLYLSLDQWEGIYQDDVNALLRLIFSSPEIQNKHASTRHIKSFCQVCNHGVVRPYLFAEPSKKVHLPEFVLDDMCPCHHCGRSTPQRVQYPQNLLIIINSPQRRFNYHFVDNCFEGRLMSVLYTDNRIHDTKCLHEMAGMKYVNIDHNATNFCVKAVVYSISKFNVDDSPMEGFTKAAVMKIGTLWNKKKDPPPPSSSSSSKNKSSAPNVNNPKAKPNHPNSNPHINADDDDQYEQFYGQNDDAGGGPSNYYPNQKNNRDNNDPYNNNLTYSGEIPLSSLSSIVGDDHNYNNNNNVVPNVTSPRDDNKPAANRSGIIVRRKNGPNDLGIGGAEVDGGIPLRSSADIPIINNNNNNNNNNAVIPNVNFNRLNENEKCAMLPSSTYIQQQQQLQQQQLPQQNNYISSYNVVQPPNYKNMPPNADNQYANQNQYYQAAPPQNDYSNAFPSVPTNPPPAIPTRQHNQQNPHSHNHQNQDLAEIKQYPGTLRLLLIPNLGNTCYFNTAIQILRSIIAPVDGNSLNVGNGNGNSELEMIVRDLMLIYGRQTNYAYIERVAQYLRDHTHHKILRHEQADCSEIFFSIITELKTNAVSLLSQIEFELGGIGMQCSTRGAQNFDERVMGKYYTITADHVSTIDEVFNSFFFPTKIIDTCQGCGAREVRVKGMKFLKKKSKYFVVVIPSPTTANIQITPFVNIAHMNLKLSLSCFSIHNGTLQNGHYRFVTLTSRNLICISDDHYSNYELHFLNNRSYGNNFPDKPTILVYRIA